MAVKVGNSWVSEASYAQAKANMAEKGESTSEKVTLESLSKKYPNTSFSTSTTPFSGSGRNNISIAPNILTQMNQDPEKRLEYEALIQDFADLQKTMPDRTVTGSKLKAQGFMIHSDGSTGGWCITEPNNTSGGIKNVFQLAKDKKESWMDQLLKGADKKEDSWNSGFSRKA